MEALLPQSVLGALGEMIAIANRDPHAELEVKVLGGLIQTKDVADRIVRAIQGMIMAEPVEEHRLTMSYPDGLRVQVVGPEHVFKVFSTESFRNVPLIVERKRKYFDLGNPSKLQDDVLDIPDLKLRATLRHEEQLRKDFTGAPFDPKNHIRLMNRKSWRIGPLRIDMSLVKSKKKSHRSLGDILKQTPEYELEVEIVDKTYKNVLSYLLRVVEPLLVAYQQSPFLLMEADVQRYRMEFERLKMRFVNPVTLERRHLRADRPHNILSGYTVTNKADGERCFLVVAQDKRLLRVTKDAAKIAWTGLTATKDVHIGDVLDGEYLVDRNLYCIFDIYQFRGKNTMRLPLMTTDDDVTKDPLKSRLGCAHLFVDDLSKEFTVSFNKTPFRVETKLFLAGNGPMMEKAIRTMLDTRFEYPTDGLIFTPRESPVAPVQDRKGDTWLRVYKWKPPMQNSIDFLVKLKPEESYDPVLQKRVAQGTLFVSRSPGSDIVYPCETLTGEYTPPTLPPDLQVLAEARDRVPTPFQPGAPKTPDACQVLIPLNPRGQPVDEDGNRVEDNTIIECSRDTDTNRWVVMRTRYDKTYKYRVLGRAEFGNDTTVADAIWTNIHNPVTENMIRNVASVPPDDTFEDNLYFRDGLEARDRVMRDLMAFHNRIKETLYQTNVKAGDTLLELAVGRANDLHKWRKTKPAKVVGIDLVQSNLEAPKQGACVRYIQESKKSKLPPVLFIQGDMTQPLLEQDSRYLRLLDKREPATTPYLEQFVGLTEFDVISCQFAIHYACASEETFRTFVGNLTRHGKGLFFGTCLDGQAVYSLLLGKSGHTFRADGQIFGEVTKDYADGEAWTEDFGRAIQVKLESFEQPQQEFLVPFGKVTEILRENGFELVAANMFSDEYASQNDLTLSQDLQAYSFLHRSFVFKRMEKKPEKKEEEVKTEEVEKKEEKKEETEEKPKKKLLKVKVPAGPEPVFFFAGNPALNDTKEFSNLHEAPVQIDGITFPTVEHYIQWSKAKMFGDTEMEAKILKTSSSKSVKGYGNKIKDFKEEEWAPKQEDIMRVALKAKFTQHPELRTKLLETGDRPLAEADPRDKVWGIGTSADTSKAKDTTRWPGKNRLGHLLGELRSQLKTDTSS